MTANKQIRDILEEILTTARERRRRESGICGGGEVWEEETDYKSDG